MLRSFVTTTVACLATTPCVCLAQQAAAPAGSRLLDNSDPTLNLPVTPIAPGLRYVIGRNVSSNTIVIDTSAGAVIIDTSRPPASRAHFDVLNKNGVTKAAYVILTHGHGDHTGGVDLWKKAGAKVVAQENFAEFLQYQRMLTGFFAIRNGAQYQFAGGQGAAAQSRGSLAALAQSASIVPDITFAKQLSLDVGDTHLELYHTPGETPDHLTVWLPKLKAAFLGDNYYQSFPNMYTLRGTRPRWPAEYIQSLEKVLSLQPEIVVPSHGTAIVGKAEITRRLTQMRDAIKYVHDAVIAGMNAGKDARTLMDEIKLPKELDVGEGYGKISWSVRGIYESYAGWFNGDPAEMFSQSRSSVSPSLVALAGGAQPIADEAQKLLKSGKEVEALHLTAIGLEGSPGDKSLLRARIAAFETLIKASTNRNEVGWLQQGLAQAKTALGQ